MVHDFFKSMKNMYSQEYIKSLITIKIWPAVAIIKSQNKAINIDQKSEAGKLETCSDS